jgi:ABC-type sugar transport system permease subunit
VKPNQPIHLEKKKRNSLLKTDGFKAIGFLGPSIILFAVFMFYPIIKTIYLSLFVTGFRGEAMTFIGFKSYITLLTSPDFLNSLWITVQFVLMTVIPGIILSFLLALLLEKSIKGIGVFQTIVFSPVTMSVATASTIGLLLFNPSISLLNYILSFVGLDNLQWLTTPFLALIAISLITIWMNIGLNTIIILGALKSVPDDLYDSSKIDGASYWRTVWNVTVPVISPSLFFVLVVTVISAFQTFGQVNILTTGGPNNSTNLLVYSIYRDAFFNFKFGYASAQAVILFLIILILTLIQFWVIERKVFYK